MMLSPADRQAPFLHHSGPTRQGGAVWPCRLELFGCHFCKCLSDGDKRHLYGASARRGDKCVSQSEDVSIPVFTQQEDKQVVRVYVAVMRAWCDWRNALTSFQVDSVRCGLIAFACARAAAGDPV